MNNLSLDIFPMRLEDMAETVSLVEQAMNLLKAQYARESFERHFAIEKAGSNDGRYYFLVRQRSLLVAFTGLHHWAWGPAENVWLGWFAVAPSKQGEGLGTRLLVETEKRARALGYKKLFVETYDHPDFKRALGFYTAKGFKPAGWIDKWLPGGEAMIVLSKEI